MITVKTPAQLPQEFTWSRAFTGPNPETARTALLRQYPWMQTLPMAWVTSNNCLHVAGDWDRKNERMG